MSIEQRKQPQQPAEAQEPSPGSMADSFNNASALLLRALAQGNVQKAQLYTSTLDRISECVQQLLRHCPLQELQTAKLPVPASELIPVLLPILVAKTMLCPVPAYSIELVHFTYCLHFFRLSISLIYSYMYTQSHRIYTVLKGNSVNKKG